MDPSNFVASMPGTLVRTYDGAFAFVPAPLPETISLDPVAVRLLADAENSLGRLVGTTGRIMNPYLIGSPLLHREAIVSSRIEGTITTPEELVLFEISGPSQDSHYRDTREVVNYITAMQHGLNRLKELPVCLRLIREIHGELVRGARGERDRPGDFRDSQNWVGNTGESIHAARFVPPPVAEMTVALDHLERYLNRTVADHHVPLLVELALLHYQFETIRPFRDGNGRIGRLLMPLLLCGRGRMTEPLLYLSAFFERHRVEYMDLLLRVSQTGDWDTWIRFFLRGVVESANEAVGQAEGLIALRDDYHRRFQSARSSGLLQRLIDELFKRPAITIKQAAKVLRVTDAAASNNIDKLQAAGILRETTGKKRNMTFIATEIVAFMHDTEGQRPRTAPTVQTTSVS
jgi:cell filamentation protein, protein adenylyltransferase